MKSSFKRYFNFIFRAQFLRLFHAQLNDLMNQLMLEIRSAGVLCLFDQISFTIKMIQSMCHQQLDMFFLFFI